MAQEGRKRMAPVPSLEDLAQFRSVSATRYVDRVRGPMLFMLGAKDRRVVLRDTELYVAALKAREGAPVTRVILFPEDHHALDKPQTQFECQLTWAWWLKLHAS